MSRCGLGACRGDRAASAASSGTSRSRVGCRSTLDLRTGANEADLDLTDLRLAELSIQTGASKTVARLPSTGRYTVRVQGGAMNVRLEVPHGVAARVETHGGLSDVRVDPHRFPRWGGEWRSADFDTAEHRADIRLETGAARVDVV